MGTITLSKQSWHFWLASRHGGYQRYKHSSICSYVRCVLWGIAAMLVKGLILGAGLVILLSVIVISIGALGAGAVAYLKWASGMGLPHSSSFPHFGMVMWGVIGFVVIACLGLWAGIKVRSRYKGGFITEAYRSFETKTCRRIDFQ